MTKQDYQKYSTKAVTGGIKDELNPIFILSSTDSSLLVKVANQKIDIVALAKIELEMRGLNLQGQLRKRK